MILKKEEYYFSVVDVIEVLTDSNIPKRYWTDIEVALTDLGETAISNNNSLNYEYIDEK